MQLVNRLITPWNKDVVIHKQLEHLAKSLGWFPSDIVEELPNSPCTGHLLVEHGLDNAAVISFINSNFIFSDLSSIHRNEILKLSYNNLVDIHITVDRNNVTAIHNRVNGSVQQFYQGSLDASGDNLTSDFFDGILRQKKIQPNIKALDDAFIETISSWKRILHADLNYEITNEQLSSLFNSLIFVRAVEDTFGREQKRTTENALIDSLLNKTSVKISDILVETLKQLGISKWPEHLIAIDDLKAFDNRLHYSQVYKLFTDFYTNKFAPYSYDFSIISKHALSRIYERYVSILKVEETPQTSLFPAIAEEQINKMSGSYYTPQFIARFFTRYIVGVTGNSFNKAYKILEPAVGSGIFLRTYLEYVSNENLGRPDAIDTAFTHIEGIDKNVTACNAARLSISLLYLAACGELPSKKIVNIVNEDSLNYVTSKRFRGNFDFFISNPPFVAHKNLAEDDRMALTNYLGELNKGKPDLYFAFILMTITSLKPGGIALLVLPNTFLVSESAAPLRELIKKETLLRCIIDLSGHEVFPGVGVYPILLIYERVDQEMLDRAKIYNASPRVQIAVIQDSVGKALVDLLNKRTVESSSYSIYEVNQEFFESDKWHLFPPSQYSLVKKLDSYRKLSDFLDVRYGFISGSTEAFILSKKDIPKGESELYVPYLSDREMLLYSTPKTVDSYLFYPFVDGVKIDLKTLKKNYPSSFIRLEKHKDSLKKRSEVKAGKSEWWEPNRPRDPDFMLVPKIVTPHLVFTPRFSLDIQGIFAVSRSPFLALKEGMTDDMLYYVTAVLNSRVCFWYMLSHTPKYQHGYAMLEKRSLINLPIPDPDDPKNKIAIINLISLIKERIKLKTENTSEYDLKIEEEIAKLYNLTPNELNFLKF